MTKINGVSEINNSSQTIKFKKIIPLNKSKVIPKEIPTKVKGYALPKNHIVFYAAVCMQQFCSELFKKFNLICFRHVRLYDEGSRFELTTDPEWTKHFMEQGYFNYTRLDRNGKCYQSGYFLWDAWNKNTPAYEIVMRDALQNFDGGLGFSILRRSTAWVDKFDFSSSIKNARANETFLNNIHLLDDFVNYFLIRMSSLVEKAHQSREFLPFVIDPSEEYADTFLPKHILSAVSHSEEKKQTNNCLSLTKRELECLYWLSLGKTTSEIALIFDGSARTVEKFIISIKEKFKCRTLFQVGQIMSAVKLDQLLQGMRYR